MSFTRITTAGAGTMGSQVAWQMAFHGKQVVVYDAIPEGLEKGEALHRDYAEHFVERRGATSEQIDETFARLSYTTDLAAAVGDADLISEPVPEALSIKGVLLARRFARASSTSRVRLLRAVGRMRARCVSSRGAAGSAEREPGCSPGNRR